MPDRFAMKLSEELLSVAEQFSGAPVGDMFDDTPYIVFTVLNPTEFNMKLMSEEEMFANFKDDSNLQILT